MARGVYLAFTYCTDPAREEEFNRWYTHTHLPDLSRAKGFVRARRFETVGTPASPTKYLTIYEFESDDLKESARDLVRLARNAFAEGRHIDCLALGDVPTPLLLFGEIDPASLEPLAEVNYPTTPPAHLTSRRTEG
jgi:hypothetical protein